MVVLDSTHEGRSVLDELYAYGQLVTPGSYIIVQDTRFDRLYRTREFRLQDTPGWASPLVAVEDFLAANPGVFIADRKRERFGYSQHVKGYLRRINNQSVNKAELWKYWKRTERASRPLNLRVDSWYTGWPRQGFSKAY